MYILSRKYTERISSRTLHILKSLQTLKGGFLQLSNILAILIHLSFHSRLYVVHTCYEVSKYSYLNKLEIVGVAIVTMSIYLGHYYCRISE